MDMKELKGDRSNPIKDVYHKFKYSFQGMAYCFKNETSFIFEFICMIVLVILGIVFHITIFEWAASLVSMLLIMGIEFLNTAIEATVDMVTQKFHPLAKIAKDCGSAATCVASLIALIVNAVIFVPEIWTLIVK